jgi:hypothetical protein
VAELDVNLRRGLDTADDSCDNQVGFSRFVVVKNQVVIFGTQARDNSCLD